MEKPGFFICQSQLITTVGSVLYYVLKHLHEDHQSSNHVFCVTGSIL